MKSRHKESDVRTIPASWKVSSLKDITYINKDSRDPSREDPNKTFIYVDIDSVENDRGQIKGVNAILGKEAPSRARRVIHHNDVIMSTVRPYLKAFAIIPKDYDNQICSTGFSVFTCKEDLYPQYLLYSLFSKFVIDQCNRMMVGAQYPAMNVSQVEKLVIHLPPLPEQRKIAEILSTADEAISKVDEAIEKALRLKKGLMQDLLTRGIGHKELKKTDIGIIPNEWEVVPLGTILDLCQYGLSLKFSGAGKYPILKMDNLENGYATSNKLNYVDLDENTFKQYKLNFGDILFNRTNSYELVGRTGIFTLSGDFVFASYLIRLRPNHEIVNPFFLTFYLVYSNNRMRKLASRAVHQANINATNLKKFGVPVPPLKEQQKIAEIIKNVDRRLELLRGKKATFEKIKKGLMNDLLTGRKRVRLEA